MSFKEKSTLLSRSPSHSSSKPPLPSSSSQPLNPNPNPKPLSPPPQTLIPPSAPAAAPTAILWDMENCPTPSDVPPLDVSSHIRSALRSHPSPLTLTAFSAFGDFNGFPRRLREGCQRTGVKLVDVPNGRKDAADKAILVDMFLFALDNRPPCSIVLISGDVDFAPALHILGQRGYTIILVVPSSVAVSTALCSAGQYVWDWGAMARGQGLVPAPTKGFNARGTGTGSVPDFYLRGTGSGSVPDFNPRGSGSGSVPDFNPRGSGTGSVPDFNPRGSGMGPDFIARGSGSGSVPVSPPIPVPVPVSVPDVTSRFGGRFSLDDEQNDEETIVYRGTREMCSSISACDVPEGQFGNFTSTMRGEGQFGNFTSTMRGEGQFGNFTSTMRGMSEGPSEEPDREDQDKWWVRPGDFNGLKGQLVRLLEISGGTIPLVKVPSEYLRLYGRHLYMSEYGACKLMHLFSKMNDAFIVIGQGKRKTICLRNTCDANNMKMCASTPIILKRGEKIEDKVVCSSEESSDEEKNMNEFDELMGRFKLEVQELLVCFGCPVDLTIFEGLYCQKYKRMIEYCKYGVNGLEDLIEKVPDVVELIVDDETKRKFLIPSFLVG